MTLAKKVAHLMPPKKATSGSKSSVTVDSIYEAGERLATSENEADFKVLLSGLEAGPREKVAAIQFLARYADKFPKSAKTTMSGIKSASTDEDESVRTTVYRELAKFTPLDAAEVNEIMFAGLGDSDEKIVATIRTQMKKIFDEGGEEFQNAFFEAIPKQKAQAQAQMVDLVRENMTFTEESASKLIPVLEAAFKTNVKEGLLLFRKNRKLLKEEDWKPLIDELVVRFDNSLKKQFEQVLEHLLAPILDNTKCMGEDARRKLVETIGLKILPKWAELKNSQKIAILQNVSEMARDCENEQVLENLYKNVFLTLNTEKVNFSIVEGLLFAFLRLARKFPKTASQLIGMVLVYTGQPSESEGVQENEDSQAEFRSKIEAVKAVCDPFIEQCELNIKNAKLETGEERKKKMDDALKARRAGGNTRKLCTVFLSPSPLQAKPPSWPSWVYKKKAKGKFGKTKRFNDRRKGDESKRVNDRRRPGNRRPFR